MLFAELVAFQTALARFLTGELFEADDLAYVARFGVLFPGTVARLATLPLDAVMLIKHRFPVRSTIVGFSDVFMAGLAGISTYILRRIGRPIAEV